MKDNINFLKSTSVSEKKSTKAVRYRTISILSLIVYIFVLVVVFTINMTVVGQEKDLKRKIGNKKEQINKLAEVESRHTLVEKRLKLISNLLGENKKDIGVSNSMDRIRNLISDEVEMNSFTIDNAGYEVSLNGRVFEVVDLIDFFEKISELKVKEGGFDNLLVSGLRLSEEGYLFELDLKIDG